MKEIFLTTEEIQFLVGWFIISKEQVYIKDGNPNYQKTLDSLLEKLEDAKK